MSLVSSATVAANPWIRILGALEKKINRTTFETWLKPTRFSRTEAGVLYIRVPRPEFLMIEEKYSDLILEAIDNLGLELNEVKFVTEEDDPTATPLRHTFPAKTDGAAGPAATAAARLSSQSRFDFDSAAQLNSKYTFDGFVIGASNQFAHAAARAVAENPSKCYNPLFLYGGVGMGKTHLMQAIGHEVKRNQPQLSICYISSEKFTNEVINSLRYDRMGSFRDRYRNVDVLLVDDIQLVAGRSAPRKSSSTPSTRCTSR